MVTKKKVPMTQQEFLRDAMQQLGMTRKQLAERICTTKYSVDNWLMPSGTKGFRPLDSIAEGFIKEILANSKK